MHRDGYDELRYAIVKKAIEDFKNSHKALKRVNAKCKSEEDRVFYHNEIVRCESLIMDCERFFQSERYDELCGADGLLMLKELRKWVKENV